MKRHSLVPLHAFALSFALAGCASHVALPVAVAVAGTGPASTSASRSRTGHDHAANAQIAALIDDTVGVPAVGSLEIRTGAGEPQSAALDRLDVRAKIEGDFVRAEVEHVFTSRADSRTEGTFRFPLPEGAILLGLAMEIDGRLMEGAFVEREKAQKVFEQIEDQMRDPALLEWDQGTVFKLRVFPIDPGEHKRIVLRYAAPLGRSGFAYPIKPADGQTIGRATMSVDGKTLLDEKGLSTRRDVSFAVPNVPAIVEETRDGDRFLAVHARPDWSRVAAPVNDPGPKRVIVVADTSRSMLEERKLALGAVRRVLDSLGQGDQFRLVASDLTARPIGALRPVTPASIDEAVAAIAAIEPEGASDVGAMLRKVSEIARAEKATSVVYIGDGSATWGETKAGELARIAGTNLGIPMHALLLGDRADVDAMQAVAAATGAMLDHPRTEDEAARFAKRVAGAGSLKRLVKARIVASSGEVFPDREQTLYEGDELVALVRAPKGAAPPVLALHGGGMDAAISSPTAAPFAAKLVAGRWAKAKIGALEAAPGDHKDEIVKLSLGFEVLSKHTSLLVLESDEAYAQFDIARKKSKNDADPRVSGADLESASSRVAHLDPDHLQPGDPEVRIDAPANARKVTVVLPFGETKEASYDAAVHAWTARFLVDRDTPDGTYEVLVTIVHEDGTAELQRLHYVVDTQHPDVEVTMRPSRGRPGTWEIRATQVVSEREIAAAIPAERRTGTLDEQRARFANELKDARRVDVRLPDGRVMTLTPIALGEFRGFWTPTAPPTSTSTLHVVAFDRARNQLERDVTVAR